MGCTYRAQLNELWSIWYTILAVALQGYLIRLGLERHDLYHNVKWPTTNGGYPTAWLNVYFGLYWACVPLCFLMFAFGIFKTGNIPGDCEKLAARENRTIEVTRNKKGEKKGCLHRMKTLWQHSPPIPQLLHVVIALCQLLAQQLMIAQLYRHGFMNSGDALNTEMDFVYQRERQLASNLPLSETVYQGFRLTASQLSDFPVSANILPLLMNVRLFGIPLEFFNLVVALIAYSSTYPSVFWRVHKGFSLVFSFHLLVCSLTMIWTYFAFAILYRIQETNNGNKNSRPIGLSRHFVNSRLFVLHPYAIIGTFVASMSLMLLAPTTLYTYAYNKYYVNMISLQSKNRIRSGTHSDYSQTCKSYSRVSRELCCEGYGSNIVGIIFLVLIILAKGPNVYALLVLWLHEGNAILLTCLIIDITYFFTWILTWLFLTLKKDWNFNVAHQAYQIYGLQKGAVSGHVQGNENPSQLKNALIMVHGDHMFVTEDQAVKQSLLRHAQRNPLEPTESIYMKQNGLDSTRGTHVADFSREDSKIDYPGPKSVDDERMPAYQQISHSHHHGQSSNGHNPVNGTMQGMSTLQRFASSQQCPAQHQNTYASIHKQRVDPIYQRQNSIDSGLYGQMEKSGSHYGTYSRLPTQARVPVMPNYQMPSTPTSGAADHTLPRRPQHSEISAIRQSPLCSERQPHGLMMMQNTQITGSREQSPYQTPGSNKMSSFNNAQKGGNYGVVSSQWARPPNHQMIYAQNKPPLPSDANHYATMGITSHTNSQPTSLSPSSSVVAHHDLHDTNDEEVKQQKPTRQTSGIIRHAVKVVEVRPEQSLPSRSDNVSCRDTDEDFATSIV